MMWQRYWGRRPPPGHMLVSSLSALLLASACTVGPDYRAPAPAGLALPGAYQTPSEGSASAVELQRWWTGFHDPLLSRLIEVALAANNDLDAAGARLRVSRAAVREARGARLPAIGVSAAADQALFDSNDAGNGRSGQIGIDAAWEADLFGGTRRAVEAARAQSQAFEANLHAVHLAIAAEVALNYIDARNAQAQLAIATSNLAYQDESVEIAGWRVQAGLVSALDLEQARVFRAQTAATLPLLANSFAAAANRIASLTGQAPGVVAPQLAAVTAVPLAPDDIRTGLPAALIQNRPDLIAAERALAAETARIGVATAQLYPALRLSGLTTTTATSFGSLGSSLLGGLTSAITAPLFQGGRIRAQIEGQTATADAALADYRQTVLIALEEVETAFVILGSAKRREAVLVTAEASARTAAQYARSQYRSGLIDFQTLLESDRSLLASEDSRAVARAARATAAIRLYKALGGGWSADDPLPGTAASR